MMPSSISTSGSLHISPHIEDYMSFVTDNDHDCHHDQPLPLTSSNLEILQMTCQIHTKHHYILSYVKNQVSILAMEAKLQHQRWREIQTLVPLEAAPFEKETIICCVDNKDVAIIDPSDDKSNHKRKNTNNNRRRKEKEKLSSTNNNDNNNNNGGEYSHNSMDNEKMEIPKLQKRHSWMFPKRRRQRSCHHHHHHHSVSYSSQQHTNSFINSAAHQKQKYDQEKMDLIRQGLCGSSSSIMSPTSSTLIEDYCHHPPPNHLASILFSSLITSCTSSNSLTSSSFSFFNSLRDSTKGDPTFLLTDHSDFKAEKSHVFPPTITKRRYSNPSHQEKQQYISPSTTSSLAANEEEESSIKYWWKRYRTNYRGFNTKTNCSCNSQKCHHHDCADFLAFRYPKMIPFHRLRDTALQVLLSPDQLRQQQVEHNPSLVSFPSSSSRVPSAIPFPSS